MAGLTYDDETAAMEGLTVNLSIPIADRLQLARQVIERLHARERERVRTAVADTLLQAFTYRATELDLSEGETQVRSWTMETGSLCPLCVDVECGEGCPLARVREELG